MGSTVAAIATVGAAALAPPAATAPMPTISQPAEDQLPGLIKDYRRAHHAPPLTGQPRLQAAAAWYAADMARNDSFSHTHVDSLGRPPEDRFRQFGYRWAVAEVSASGPTTSTSALAYWTASPGHNAILIDPRFHQLGIGIGFNPQTPDRYFWAVSLGTGPGARTSLTILVEPPHHRRHALRLHRAPLSSRPQLPELALPRARAGPKVPPERAMKATRRRRAVETKGSGALGGLSIWLSNA
jgi:uncharacterized protein YkwD